MKILFLGLCFLLCHSLLGQPYDTNGVLAALDIDGDGQIDSSYLLHVLPNNLTLVGIGFVSDDQATYLKAANKSPGFSSGESIALSNVTFTNANGQTGFGMDPYQWYFNTQFQQVFYDRFPGGQFPTLTNVLVGLRFLGGDNEQHHAWIQLTRPNNKAGTAYQVASYDYNPVPGEPIPAGLPPPAPELLAALEPDGNLRLSWDAKYEPYYKLQGRADLFDPDGWLDLPNVFGHTFPVLPDGPTAFFRLARR